MPLNSWILFRKGWALLFLLGSIASVHSDHTTQFIDYDARIWDEKDGLPSLNIREMARTSDGFVWLGTKKGIGRFDGNRIETFSEEDYPELKNESFRVVREGPDGNVWFGTNEKVIRYDGQRFQAWSHSDQGQPLGRITELLWDRKGILWIGSREHGVFTMKPDGSIEAFAWNRLLADPHVFCLALDLDDNLWIGHLLGTQKWNREADLLEEVVFPNSLSIGMNLNEDFQHACGDIQVLSDGNVLAFMGAWPHVDFRLFKMENGSWVRIWDTILPGLGFISGKQEQHNTVYVRGVGASVAYIEDHTNSRTVHRLRLRNNLEYNDLESGLVLPDRSFLAGIDRGGLFHLQPKWLTLIGEQEGLDHPNTFGIQPMAEEGMLISTEWGIYVVDESSKTPVRYLKQGHFDDQNVWAGLKDSMGRVWIAQNSLLWVIGDKEPELLFATEFNRWKFPEANVFDFEANMVAEMADGTIWIAGRKGIALFHYPDEPDFLPHPSSGQPVMVYSMDQNTERTRIYVGTEGQGILLYDGASLNTLLLPGRLPVHRIQCLAVSPDENRICFGNEADLFLFNKTDQTIRPLEFQGEMEMDKVCQTLFDRHGNLWIAHRGGLVQVPEHALSGQQGEFTQGSSGLPCRIVTSLPGTSFSDLCNHPKAAFDDRDQLWLATKSGVLVVNTQKMGQYGVKPSSRLERISFSGTVLEDKAGAFDLEQGDSPPHTIGKSELVSFSLSTFAMGERENLEYRFRLNDSEWIQTRDSEIQVPIDVSGKLQLEWQVRYRFHPWPKESGLFTMAFEFPWYQKTETRVGMSAVCLILIGAGLGTVRRRWRTSSIRIARASRFMERKRMTRDLHDAMGLELCILQSEVEKLKLEMTTFPAEQTRHVLDLENRLVDCMQSFRNLLWTCSPQTKSINELILYLVHYLENTSRRVGISCEFGIPENLPDLAISDKTCREMFLIFRELLCNLIKHSKADKFRFNVVLKGESIVWVLEDNGIGLTENSCIKVGLPQGMGLQSVRSRVASLNGTVQWNNVSGGGLRVEIQLKINRISGKSNLSNW